MLGPTTWNVLPSDLQALPRWCLFSVSLAFEDCYFSFGLGRKHLWLGILKGRYGFFLLIIIYWWVDQWCIDKLRFWTDFLSISLHSLISLYTSKATFFYLETDCLAHTRSSRFHLSTNILYCIDERDLFETGRNPTGNLAWEWHRSNLNMDFVKLSSLYWIVQVENSIVK